MEKSISDKKKMIVIGHASMGSAQIAQIAQRLPHVYIDEPNEQDLPDVLTKDEIYLKITNPYDVDTQMEVLLDNDTIGYPDGRYNRRQSRQKNKDNKFSKNIFKKK